MTFIKRFLEKFQIRHNPNLKTGDVVQVRSENEILATLNGRGELEGLSFSEGMRKYCGKRFRVLKQVNKIIVEGVGMRRMNKTVILEKAICDGEAFNACRRTCHFLWKEKWLIKMGKKSGYNQSTDIQSGAEKTYLSSASLSVCQALNLLEATSPFHPRDLHLYLSDIKSGAYSPIESFRVLLRVASAMFKGFLVRPRPEVKVEPGTTPTISLNLQPGELVEIKSKDEILATLDQNFKNRGLEFTAEMSKYCGKRYRVLRRLDKMYVEEAGIMRQITNTVLLDGVTCDGTEHAGCLRNCYCFCREIWVRRVQ